ncbi:MAG TPA: glycosyltransferase family 4 protein [Acidimicrobiia bacterium]|nr:glycosyltransferase family 4 protein [Acidimicrobiia bacterium]
MKILLIVPVPPAADGPGALATVMHAALTGLAERNDVTVAVAAGPELWEVEAVEQLVRDGYDVHSVDRHLAGGRARWLRRARLASTWARGRLPWRTVWFHEPRLQRVIDELFTTRTFDVVAVQDNATALYNTPPGVPRVLTEQEVRRARPVQWHAADGESWRAHMFAEADWRRWPRYQRRVWERCDLLHVYSARDAAAISRLAPRCDDRVRVAPFGIVVPKPPEVTAIDAATMLFAGNFTHPPNVDAAHWLAREIFPAVRARRPDARLLLAGAHAPESVRRSHGEGVEFLGYVDDLDSLLTRSTVFAAPVRTGGGMRMKVVHAMAMARPVVTTSRGIDGLDIDGVGPPVSVADDAPAFSRAVVDLFDDPDKAATLGRAARAFVEKHLSASAFGARLTGILAEAEAIRVGATFAPFERASSRRRSM